MIDGMQTLRSLILLILFSAIASTATAQSSAPIDGYLDVDSGPLLLISNPHEGDHFDALVSQPRTFSVGHDTAPVGVVRQRVPQFTYANYLSRAPPFHL